MSDYAWWPGLIVLALGLAGGVFLAMRLRRTGKSVRQERHAGDAALKMQDLEGRRDDLYRRLRDEGESLTESDRHQLEQAAARTLRDLEAASAELGKKSGKAKDKTVRENADGSADRSFDRVNVSRGRSLLTGFALGVGMVAIVGLLVYWAVRDTAGTGSAATATPDSAHPETALLTPEAQAEHDALRAQLERDPGDVMARKRLALLLLSNDQFVPAFQEARSLLERDPQDIDGLYVEAVVRIQMGQAESALGLLDRVIEMFPDHVQALGWRGIVLYQTGDINAAVESWERGIEAAGGQHPELEEMVAEALAEEAGRTSSSTPAAAEPTPAPLAAAPADWALSAGAELDGFGVRLELGSDVAKPQGILFVALRPSAGGPPLAVRRISDATFPLELTLTESDSMMGAALPERGVVFARLDQDGDVSASSPGDLAAEAEVDKGVVTVLRLQP
jgi:tetratricopeptide (TPR) repeat protein